MRLAPPRPPPAEHAASPVDGARPPRFSPNPHFMITRIWGGLAVAVKLILTQLHTMSHFHSKFQLRK